VTRHRETSSPNTTRLCLGSLSRTSEHIGFEAHLACFDDCRTRWPRSSTCRLLALVARRVRAPVQPLVRLFHYTTPPCGLAVVGSRWSQQHTVAAFGRGLPHSAGRRAPPTVHVVDAEPHLAAPVAMPRSRRRPSTPPPSRLVGWGTSHPACTHYYTNVTYRATRSYTAGGPHSAPGRSRRGSLDRGPGQVRTFPPAPRFIKPTSSRSPVDSSELDTTSAIDILTGRVARHDIGWTGCPGRIFCNRERVGVTCTFMVSGVSRRKVARYPVPPGPFV